MQAFALPLNCGSVITGSHSGPLDGVLGHDVPGRRVRHRAGDGGSGASFAAVGGSIGGPLNASGGAGVSVDGTSIGGPVDLERRDRPGVASPTRRSRGRSALSGNATGTTPIVLGDNTIGGGLSCTGNAPPPVNNAQPNAVSGPESGQCAGL